MRLGTDTASLTNALSAFQTETPYVGMPATFLAYTDRYGGTITFASATAVVFQRDRATRVDTLGMTDCGQRYEYERDCMGAATRFTLRKNGRYYAKGQKMGTGPGLRLGARDEHYDFSF